MYNQANALRYAARGDLSQFKLRVNPETGYIEHTDRYSYDYGRGRFLDSNPEELVSKYGVKFRYKDGLSPKEAEKIAREVRFRKVNPGYLKGDKEFLDGERERSLIRRNEYRAKGLKYVGLRNKYVVTKRDYHRLAEENPGMEHSQIKNTEIWKKYEDAWNQFYPERQRVRDYRPSFGRNHANDHLKEMMQERNEMKSMYELRRQRYSNKDHGELLRGRSVYSDPNPDDVNVRATFNNVVLDYDGADEYFKYADLGYPTKTLQNSFKLVPYSTDQSFGQIIRTVPKADKRDLMTKFLNTQESSHVPGDNNPDLMDVLSNYSGSEMSSLPSSEEADFRPYLHEGERYTLNPSEVNGKKAIARNALWNHPKEKVEEMLSQSDDTNSIRRQLYAQSVERRHNSPNDWDIVAGRRHLDESRMLESEPPISSLSVKTKYGKRNFYKEGLETRVLGGHYPPVNSKVSEVSKSMLGPLPTKVFEDQNYGNHFADFDIGKMQRYKASHWLEGEGFKTPSASSSSTGSFFMHGPRSFDNNYAEIGTQIGGGATGRDSGSSTTGSSSISSADSVSKYFNEIPDVELKEVTNLNPSAATPVTFGSSISSNAGAANLFDSLYPGPDMSVMPIPTVTGAKRDPSAPPELRTNLLNQGRVEVAQPLVKKTMMEESGLTERYNYDWSKRMGLNSSMDFKSLSPVPGMDGMSDGDPVSISSYPPADIPEMDTSQSQFNRKTAAVPKELEIAASKQIKKAYFSRKAAEKMRNTLGEDFGVLPKVPLMSGKMHFSNPMDGKAIAGEPMSLPSLSSAVNAIKMDVDSATPGASMEAKKELVLKDATNAVDGEALTSARQSAAEARSKLMIANVSAAQQKEYSNMEGKLKDQAAKIALDRAKADMDERNRTSSLDAERARMSAEDVKRQSLFQSNMDSMARADLESKRSIESMLSDSNQRYAALNFESKMSAKDLQLGKAQESLAMIRIQHSMDVQNQKMSFERQQQLDKDYGKDLTDKMTSMERESSFQQMHTKLMTVLKDKENQINLDQEKREVVRQKELKDNKFALNDMDRRHRDEIRSSKMDFDHSIKLRDLETSSILSSKDQANLGSVDRLTAANELKMSQVVHRHNEDLRDKHENYRQQLQDVNERYANEIRRKEDALENSKTKNETDRLMARYEQSEVLAKQKLEHQAAISRINLDKQDELNQAGIAHERDLERQNVNHHMKIKDMQQDSRLAEIGNKSAISRLESRLKEVGERGSKAGAEESLLKNVMGGMEGLGGMLPIILLLTGGPKQGPDYTLQASQDLDNSVYGRQSYNPDSNRPY